MISKIKKNLKLSIYFKKHVLKKYEGFDGVHYIMKHKGRRRLSAKSIKLYESKIYDVEFWNQIVNGSSSTHYKNETDYIIDKIEYYSYKGKAKSSLMERQKYALNMITGSVLDIGCFDGLFLCALAEQGIDCHGMDFSDEFLRIARGNFKSAGGNPENIKKGLFQKLPFEDSSFDSVVSQETFEHITLPVQFRDEIYRVLKPGGIFCGSVPLENRIDSVSHIMYYTPEGIKALLESKFNIKEIKTIKHDRNNNNENLIVWTVEKR